MPAATGQSWSGRIDRALGEVDPQGRMARVAVLVADPYGLKQNHGKTLPLAVGSFVDATLQGSVLEQVVELPRRALREENTVWIMDGENKLRILPVEVLRLERETALISRGLKGGEQVVVSPVSGAADGLLLRQAE
jgi:hypothetical protein